MKFSDLKLKVIRLLQDEDISAETLHDAATAALDAILPWFALRSSVKLTGDGEKDTFTLPADLYEIDAVMLSASGETLPQAVLQPGNIRGAVHSWGDWIEFPYGSISFSKVLKTGEELTLLYRSHWPKPEDLNDDDYEFSTPEYTHNPIVIYAAAHALTSKASETANIRQFSTRVDSGNPEHNPIADRVDFLHRLFTTEMDRHPRQIAGARA